jgi:adenylate kinase family enzyme
MKAVAKQKEFITFSPELRAADLAANYWMRQVTIRLRREICWCWHERGLQPSNAPATLPPYSDRVSTTLDLSRFWLEKQDFFMTDPTARYLTEQLDTKERRARIERTGRGSFGWVVNELTLDDVSAFLLALSLTVAFDGSMGSVIAACLNDQMKSYPNLALAQKLWDEPEQVLRLADPFHPLFRYGLIKYSGQSGHYFSETGWEAPITVPSLVAGQLLFPETPFPHGLIPLHAPESDDELTETARLVSLRLSAADATTLRIVPVIGAKGSARHETARAIAQTNGKALVEFSGETANLEDRHYLNSLATVCWLKDAYLFFSQEPPLAATGDKQRGDRSALPAATIPATLFLAVSDRGQLAQWPTSLLLPAIQVPPATYQQRLECWKGNLGARARRLGPAIAECARRFRFEKETIRAVCAELKEFPGEIAAPDFISACRAELDSDIGELASRVTPRFNNEELILPHKQHVLFAEILKAMQSLTEVHYGWGTARVWNESGISVLFAGPPGTGKTMAAEILSSKLDLPMYRIDLSQVVNKYIGETEKNLKRVFDAADVSDMILFFDEADSLFGRRIEVSDAHDRYANLEISYLLERMERFKGLAILATNRKKDLDEAFLRRLRYVVDFPLPDAPERKRIWQQVIPERADSSELEFDFLAEQFPLAGGNIRSIVFNACLQCAAGSGLNGNHGAGRLTMAGIVVAVKREYDKMNRTVSREQYGSYAPLIEGLDRE